MHEEISFAINKNIKIIKVLKINKHILSLQIRLSIFPDFKNIMVLSDFKNVACISLKKLSTNQKYNRKQFVHTFGYLKFLAAPIFAESLLEFLYSL